jgi:TatD DNase family protein
VRVPVAFKFVKNIPLNLLVLETDSPFLLPEPLRSRKEYPNEPKNITVITEFVANILNKTKEEIAEVTSNNAKRLFQLK